MTAPRNRTALPGVNLMAADLSMMPERTIKRRLQDCDTALASDEGPLFSTLAKLVETHGMKVLKYTLSSTPSKL